MALASRNIFMALEPNGIGLEGRGLGHGLGLESCTDSFWHHLQTQEIKYN